MREVWGEPQGESMLPNLDRQLWRFFHHGITSFDIAARTIPPLLLLAVLAWWLAERRFRHVWRQTPSPAKETDAKGPYRTSRLPAFFMKAPARTRALALYGIALGFLGIVWPILLVLDLAEGTLAIASILIEAVGTVMALLACASGFGMLANRNGFGRREARLLIVVAILYGGLGLLYLAGAFDGLVVNVYGIKMHTQMQLGEFTRSGFGLLLGTHMGVAWRLLLRTSSIYGLLAAFYAALWSRAILRNPPGGSQSGYSEEMNSNA